jgi:hypothetical protein
MNDQKTAALNEAQDTTIATSGQRALVHKTNYEGAIEIDPVTGYILTPHDERPDWASELTLAQTTERDLFYTDRLGEGYTSGPLFRPEVYAFEDLAWFGAREYPVDAPYINAETNEEEPVEMLHIEADHEFRQGVLMEAMDVRAELDAHGNETGNIEGAVSVAIAADNERSPEEIEELERQQATGFSAVAQ